MIRTKDNRDQAEVEKSDRARIETLQRVVREQQQEIESLKKIVSEMEQSWIAARCI